jgi:hypothetical protein
MIFRGPRSKCHRAVNRAPMSKEQDSMHRWLDPGHDAAPRFVDLPPDSQ